MPIAPQRQCPILESQFRGAGDVALGEGSSWPGRRKRDVPRLWTRPFPRRIRDEAGCARWRCSGSGMRGTVDDHLMSVSVGRSNLAPTAPRPSPSCVRRWSCCGCYLSWPVLEVTACIYHVQAGGLEVDCVGQCCKGPTGVDMERFDNFRFLFRERLSDFLFFFSSRLQSRIHCEACLLQHDRAARHP